MGDPTQMRLREEAELPVEADVPAEAVPVGAGVGSDTSESTW